MQRKSIQSNCTLAILGHSKRDLLGRKGGLEVIRENIGREASHNLSIIQRVRIPKERKGQGEALLFGCPSSVNGSLGPRHSGGTPNGSTDPPKTNSILENLTNSWGWVIPPKCSPKKIKLISINSKGKFTKTLGTHQEKILLKNSWFNSRHLELSLIHIWRCRRRG